MSSLPFECDNIHPFAIGLLQTIYKRTVTIIKERKARPQDGRFDGLFIISTLTSIWEEEWETPMGQQLRSLLTETDLETIDHVQQKLRTALMQYVIRIPLVICSDPQDETLPVCDGYHWRLMRKNLASNFKDAVVESIDLQSSRVLQQILLPKDNSNFRKMGLVVGQVQSGKTANYSALIAKATDIGYKIIIVFSGIHNDLRDQTQFRLDEEFLGFHEYQFADSQQKTGNSQESIFCGVGLDADYDPQKAPNCATYTDEDFRGTFKKNGALTYPLLFVVKKNPAIFDKLIDFCAEKVVDKDNWPLLVIDDEADQASINTKRGELTTATNQSIRSLLQLFPKATFVGYTATPFANVLINASADHKRYGIDLFPRDFIVRLPAPPNYFGPAQFFGDDDDKDALDLFMRIPEEASKAWIMKKGRKSVITDAIPEECRKAVLQYILSASIRQWRHKRNHPSKWADDIDIRKPVIETSMLVHVSSRVSEQRQVADQFLDIFKTIRSMVLDGNEYDCEQALEGMQELFDQQSNITDGIVELRGDHDLELDWHLPQSLEELMPEIRLTLEDAAIWLVNGETKLPCLLDRCESSFVRPYAKHVIFIGGNKLSRGLTLPGLCVSIFLRSTTMYDTLLQMGRWFGYRDGYVDLCRICTTPSIIDRFRSITEACLDFERQIDYMEKESRTPENYRLKIHSHPGLLVTARNKMLNADTSQVGFNGEKCEQRTLDLSPATLENNTFAAKMLLDSIATEGHLAYASKGYRLESDKADPEYRKETKSAGRLYRDVPAKVILDFLKTYTGAKDIKDDLAQQGIAKHIEQSQSFDELTHWNVFVPGEYDPNNDKFGCRYSPRNILSGNEEPVRLRNLKAGNHEFVGVAPEILEEAKAVVGDSAKRGALFKAVREISGKKDPQHGFLILYLLSSTGWENSPNFKEFCSQHGKLMPVVSFYLWMPTTSHGESITMSVFNKTIRCYDDEEDDIPELEE